MLGLLTLVVPQSILRAQVEPAPTAPAAARDAGIPECFEGRIRISALISSRERVKVGIVDTETGKNYLLAPGQSAGSVEVVSADYATETVVLRMNDQICSLSLAEDPDAVRDIPPEPTAGTETILYRGASIEKFLQEFPDAVEDGLIRIPLEPPELPVEGKGPTIEAFLAENPEWKAMADMVVTGRGPGIEKFLSENPDAMPSEPIPEGSLGPGIENALRSNPDAVLTNLPTLTPPEAP